MLNWLWAALLLIAIVTAAVATFAGGKPDVITTAIGFEG